MKKLQFKRIGFLIGFTLLVSIGVQAWRMYTQVHILKTQLLVDIQQSLDNAVETYFAERAKTDVITLTDELIPGSPFREIDSDTSPSQNLTRISVQRSANSEMRSPGTPPIQNSYDSITFPKEFLDRVGKSDLVFRSLSEAQRENVELDSILWKNVSEDSMHTIIRMNSSPRIGRDQANNLGIFLGRSAADSLEQMKFLTNKIIISITRDSLDLNQIDSLLQEELRRKRIEINYKLLQVNRSLPQLGEAPQSSEKSKASKPEMQFTVSRSTFLPPGQSLELYFENTTLTLLKRGVIEIGMSLTFIGIIAYAFYFLYQTIKNQKEIAEIKQDLIANITHEFKTPIATTLSAIEGIQQFNPENDPAKTSRYLGISKNQMLKLNQMVEKLLETATLDSDQLVLKKEQIEPEVLLRLLVQKFQTLAPEKHIDLILPAHCKPIFADSFHFENALSNLIDNAIKYGGNEIRICLDQNGMNKIRIHDNGGTIPSEQKDRVFEQFYRIPKGDVHDVKGFGIGLYYVKKILEKHEGKIELETGKQSTTFITYWP
ncbi:hypothetical protein D0X99_04900 [Algoriphagus lacus]|uniref:histidine kinase n=1 Tax=Algoriphagus lacus TaxID=2056311 RepID=A0A418PTY5_9BACT|nr:HAMP domain-containing sensor histidine kinase [Algoriphagus lacus]RIW17098.1 hypothetical protein D0X99_04900 [Algoriphagus lacus]